MHMSFRNIVFVKLIVKGIKKILNLWLKVTIILVNTRMFNIQSE